LRVLLGNTMLITVTGCKTGRQYSTPVGFYREGDTLWVISNRDRTWWRNVKNGANVSLFLNGKTVTAFAEAEGPKGGKTRTWFNLKDQPIFAWAGLWRISDEWGPVYSGVMTDCNEAIRPVHDRMPVLLHADEYDRWLNGSFDEALAFQDRCFPSELIEMNRTAETWSKRKVDRLAEGVAAS